jgi:heme exporter protein C
MKGSYWWKILGAVLVLYSIIAGFYFRVPDTGHVLQQTIRNVYFHVPMWFCMIALLGYSVYCAVRYLGKDEERFDVHSSQAALAAIPFALVGLLTGMLWGKATWRTYWSSDPKLNGVAAALLIYLAYFVLRSSITDEQKRARISAIYNIFAFVMMIVFILILPRLMFSIHPGNGGNPAFGKYDMDNVMRAVFYPAVAGWILIGAWIAQLRIRIETLKRKVLYED